MFPSPFDGISIAQTIGHFNEILVFVNCFCDLLSVGQFVDVDAGKFIELYVKFEFGLFFFFQVVQSYIYHCFLILLRINHNLFELFMLFFSYL